MGLSARAVALGGTPLEDHPDSLEHPPRGCRAREPLRPKRRQNVGARDGIHALRPEGRYHARERGQPLLTVFLVPEPSRVRRVDLSGRLLERREPPMRTPTLREGSPPARATFRRCTACSRASASETRVTLPSPRSHRRPWNDRAAESSSSRRSGPRGDTSRRRRPSGERLSSVEPSAPRGGESLVADGAWGGPS